MRLATLPVSLDSFSTARLDAERLTAYHWDDLRRMDQDEQFMAASQQVMRKAGLQYERDILHAGQPHLLFRTGYSPTAWP
jgi:hypothetical protein